MHVPSYRENKDGELEELEERHKVETKACSLTHRTAVLW